MGGGGAAGQQIVQPLRQRPVGFLCHVHAVHRRAYRAGQGVRVQKAHTGQALQHRRKAGGNAGAALMAAGAHLLAEDQPVIVRCNDRRHNDQHIGVGVVAPALGAQGFFHQPGDAQRY